MTEKGKISHDGIVKKINSDSIDVVVVSISACAACHAKSACTMSDTSEKIINVSKPDYELECGDTVKVYAARNIGIFSVIIAYILPTVLLLFSIFFMIYLGITEILAAIGSLFFLAIYYIVLSLFKHKIKQKIKFTIGKI